MVCTQHVSIAEKRTYIVIVNWNGLTDTIECLESVFRLHYNNYVVIVCDNNSKDNSAVRIAEWARGERLASPAEAHMALYTCPPVAKPIELYSLPASQIDRVDLSENSARLVLIKADKNLGFAGGNNLGLRHILKKRDYDYAWMVNNDAVVHPDALTCMLRRMEDDPRIGICGSKLCFYSAPHLVQAYGGATYSPMTGRNRHVGEFRAVAEAEDRATIEREFGYVVGASMLVSRHFLECVGLMNEDYFLYYEELDWATRAKGKFRLGYAPGSVVYHKQGNSMGGKSLSRKSEPEERFVVSDFYSIRNQIRFTRRYYPQYLPTVGITVAWRLLKRIAAGKRKRAGSAVRGLFSAFSGKLLDTSA